MKTQVEIDTMIQQLRDQKATLPEFSIFGDNNWLSSDKTIEVLEKKYATQDDIYRDEDSRSREITSSMLLAFDWLNGEVDDDDMI